MSISLVADPVPLRVDDDGVIRVGATRITLDVLLADHRRGMSPEDIVRELDALTLADVHGTLAYYYRHQTDLDEYLRRREEQAVQMRRLVDANQPRGPSREELRARLAARDADRGRSAQ